MARVVRNQDLVQIFATTVLGKEDLIYSTHLRDDGKEPSLVGLKLYDFGARTYTSRYSIGLAPARRHRLAETSESICKAFQKAGLTPPPVVRPYLPGRITLKTLHRVDRFFRTHGGWRTGTTPPTAQTIR